MLTFSISGLGVFFVVSKPNTVSGQMGVGEVQGGQGIRSRSIPQDLASPHQIRRLNNFRSCSEQLSIPSDPHICHPPQCGPLPRLYALAFWLQPA